MGSEPSDGSTAAWEEAVDSLRPCQFIGPLHRISVIFHQILVPDQLRAVYDQARIHQLVELSVCRIDQDQIAETAGRRAGLEQRIPSSGHVRRNDIQLHIEPVSDLFGKPAALDPLIIGKLVVYIYCNEILIFFCPGIRFSGL